jgi:hypothetical protein
VHGASPQESCYWSVTKAMLLAGNLTTAPAQAM